MVCLLCPNLELQGDPTSGNQKFIRTNEAAFDMLATYS